MVGNGGETRGAKRAGQARVTLGSLVPATLPLLLAGCASFPSSMNPVSWWHDLQGGAIAEQRPPPPGADQPYPNLASVPAKPAEPDRAALTNIADALIADRTNAQHFAATTPLPDPSSPSASPALFGRGTAAPPGPAAPPAPAAASKVASATMPGAEPPPPSPPKASADAAAAEAPPAPPAKAPIGVVQSTPLAPPTAPQSTPETVPLAPPGATAQPTPEAAPLPPLPTTPPAPPNLPGVAAAPAAPIAKPAPASAAPEPPAAPAPTTVASASPPPAPNPADSVSVTFITGSADLPSFGAASLKQLAARRGNGMIAVTGYGDAASDDPEAQSAALALGLSRAQAMATALTSAGVPASAVEVGAQAIGRGGTARLMQ